MTSLLRVLIADDERPARRFLASALQSFPGVEVVGEAASGDEAIALIEQHQPHLALLDLNMPGIGGLDVARLARTTVAPLIAFVTAHDEYAVEAFELDAIDYLLKPVEPARLTSTLARARSAMPDSERAAALAAATRTLETIQRRQHLDRIPVKKRDETCLLPVRQIASIVAERELLHLTTIANERYTICHRLHALEARLDPRRFVRLGRGTLAALDTIQRFSPLPGGTYEVYLTNGQVLQASRIQSRVLRDTLLRL
jgi:two-component system LytT family response regulator